MNEDQQLIVVEGPVGVGKTTLAARLAADLDAGLLLEDADENPFIERFYATPRQAALHTQLHFLLHRAEQVKMLQEESQDDIVVMDFLLDKDRLFAEHTLDEAELKIYDQIFELLAIKPPQPNLVVYLQAPVEVLLSRISNRGRKYEKLIDSTYLQRLTDAYARFFHYYDDAPILIVNATEIDIANSDTDYLQLREQILTVGNGRHFFNPIPA